MLLVISNILGDGTTNSIPPVLIVDDNRLQEVCMSRCTAAYIYPVIYLSEDLDLSTTHDKGIVFHELVHHYQEIKSRYNSYSDCERYNYREREAYDLQNIYYENNQVSTRVRAVLKKCH